MQLAASADSQCKAATFSKTQTNLCASCRFGRCLRPQAVARLGNEVHWDFGLCMKPSTDSNCGVAI
jgi:hypothetical protein